MDSDNMKYAVDEIIADIAVLENIDTKEKIEVNISLLPIEISDGSILIYEDNTYKLDREEEENRRDLIREKMERLKRLKDNKNV
jgi:hypothetical protein